MVYQRANGNTGSYFDNVGKMNNTPAASSGGMEGANKYNQLSSLDDIDDGLLD